MTIRRWLSRASAWGGRLLKAGRARDMAAQISTNAELKWPDRVRQTLAAKLNTLGYGVWRAVGSSIIDDHGASVRGDDVHRSGPGHIDICFELQSAQGAPVSIWDCVAGGRAADQSAAEMVAKIWGNTTAPVFLELMTRHEEFATSSMGDPTLGLAGWHSIHGPVLAYGSGDVHRLQKWMLDNALVPAMKEQLRTALTPNSVHGVKFLLGSFAEPIAEVRIDGVRDDDCSAAFAAMAWPQDLDAIARMFVLFVHPL